MSRKLLKESLNFFLKTIKMKIIDINESGTSINKNLFKELNMSNNCIFDVGANTGYVARAYSSEFKKCKIHCFEPDIQVFEKLKKNLKNDRFILNNKGVSSQNGKLTLSVDPRNSLVSSFTHDHNLSSVICDTITIDNYIDVNDISKVGLIKIDVEGHEIDVLKGAKNSLKTGKVDAVVIEGTFTPNQIKSSDFFEVNDFMVSCGFQVQGVYDLDYSHIYSKGVFKLGNFLYIKSSNPYLGN